MNNAMKILDLYASINHRTRTSLEREFRRVDASNRRPRQTASQPFRIGEVRHSER